MTKFQLVLWQLTIEDGKYETEANTSRSRLKDRQSASLPRSLLEVETDRCHTFLDVW